MSTTTFSDLKSGADNPSLVRKILEAVAFLAPDSAPGIDALTDASGLLQALPTAYKPVGMVTPDGYTFGGDTNTEAVEAYGYSAPVREDITGQTRTVAYTALEKLRRHNLELAWGMDLSGVEQGANGEIVIDHPDRPLQRFYRLIVIGRDGSGATEWFRGKFFPRVSITSFPEEVWSAADPEQSAITLSTYVDDVIGTGERDFIAGTGAAAASVALGFTQAGAP
jgi:hypothetical protein